MKNREIILRNIILYIQKKDKNHLMPSSRQLSIKYNISRTVLSRIYKNLEQNNLIKTRNKKRSLVFNDEGSMFYSFGKSNHQKIKKIVLKYEKNLINNNFNHFKKILNIKKINFNDFLSFKKYYYLKNNEKKTIILNIKKPLKKMDNENFYKLKKSLFSYLAHNSFAIYSKKSIYIKNKDKIYKFEIFQNKKNEILSFSKSLVLKEQFGIEIKNIY